VDELTDERRSNINFNQMLTVEENGIVIVGYVLCDSCFGKLSSVVLLQ